MDGNITINIVEPGTPPSPTPIDPVVPNTGLFTSGIGGPEATAIGVVLILTIAAIVVAFLYRKQKKSGKVTKLVHIIDSTKAVLKSNKHITTAVILLAILTSTGTFIALARNAVNASESDEQSQTEGTNDSSLTVDVSSEELTIEVADEPVFAILPVEVTVEEATEAGYTLTAYTDNTDLVSTTNPDNIIPMVTLPESSAETLESSETAGELSPLTDNTYGLALEEKPTTKDEAVYTSLSIDPEEPTILKSMPEYTPTEENDTTTIYYGFYITPDVPYGTYKGSTISYEAIPNLATISYNANGLYYNDDESFTTNTVGYKPSTPDSPIEELSGEYLTPAPLNSDSSSSPIHYTFLGWSKTEGATTPDYEDEEDIIASLTLSPNEDLTLYAVWHYDTVLSFNGNTSDGGEAIADITIPAGTTITLPPNTYTRTGSVFTSWNTVAIPTEQDPGESYEDEADFTAPDSSADITLYAQWAYYTTITFNGNGETSGYMSPQDIIAGTPENLVPNAFTKTNATFIGWNTQANGSGTSYSDEAEFVASSTQHEDITLYAQWAATTISFNGNTSESGTMNTITIAGGTSTTLPQNAYTKSHCTFTSWNTNPDGTGTGYPGEASYTASMDGIYSFTLYAQWQCESMINFNGNGATSGYMSGIMATGGQQTTLPQNTFTKDGYSFNGWNTVAEPTGQDPGESYPDQGTYIAPASESQNITLYAQWLPTTTITFDGNGADSGSMAPQTIVAGTPQNLTPNAFAKDGYIFNGWNTVQTPTTENPGTAYADKAQYTASTTQPESITLYAQWKIPPVIGDLTYMQDFATLSEAEKTSVLNSMTADEQYQLKDNRDQKNYYVSKLADNNIWMTQNLDLDIEAGRTYTSADTDLANSTKGTCWTPTASTSTTSSWTSSETAPSSYNPGDLYWNGNVTTSGGSLSDRTTTEPSATYGTHYHVGNYYNWTAAVAMNDSSSYTTNRQDLNQSICPAGWRLPVYSGDKSYLNLKNTQGFTSGTSGNIQSAPTYFVYGGGWNGSSSRVGYFGNYWSSVVYSSHGSNLAYLLDFSASGALNPRDFIYRDSGYSMRCVAR